MKRKIFTLAFCCVMGFTYAQVGSDFGPKDVLICNFEDVNLAVVDSLWSDTTMTTPVTAQSSNISIIDNPFLNQNESPTAVKYVRPEGGWKSIFIRFDKAISLSKTPYLQVQVYPVLDKSPASTNVDISLINDKGEIISGSGSMGNLPQDQWTTVTAFLGKLKSSDLYNAIQITINADDSLSKLGGTEYLIDQIGFKAPADGIELPATIFYETFGGYNDPWQKGTIAGQDSIPNSDGTDYVGPGEIGTAAAYASIGGFTSGIPFTFKNVLADTAAAFVARTYGMSAKYVGASGNGRMQFLNYMPGTLETGNIDVTGNTKFNLSFGIGTQQWWAYDEGIANARPKVEISVDGGAFYEIFSTSTFLQWTGNYGNFSWGQPKEYEDQIFVLVDYPFSAAGGAPLESAQTINLRMSYKAGNSFWIDDLWLSAELIPTGIKTNKAETFTVYPNPATNFVNLKNAQKVFITDLNGRMVLQSLNTAKVDVSSLAKGVYILKAQQEDGSMKIGKFIKK